MAYDTHATLTLELDFALTGDFKPGKPARMPSFSDDVGSPADPDETEWKVERIGIPFRVKMEAAKYSADGDSPPQYEWRTRWLTLDATTLKAINEALSADEGFDNQACEAIIDRHR